MQVMPVFNEDFGAIKTDRCESSRLYKLAVLPVLIYGKMVNG